MRNDDFRQDFNLLPKNQLGELMLLTAKERVEVLRRCEPRTRAAILVKGAFLALGMPLAILVGTIATSGQALSAGPRMPSSGELIIFAAALAISAKGIFGLGRKHGRSSAGRLIAEHAATAALFFTAVFYNNSAGKEVLLEMEPVAVSVAGMSTRELEERLAELGRKTWESSAPIDKATLEKKLPTMRSKGEQSLGNPKFAAPLLLEALEIKATSRAGPKEAAEKLLEKRWSQDVAPWGGLRLFLLIMARVIVEMVFGIGNSATRWLRREDEPRQAIGGLVALASGAPIAGAMARTAKSAAVAPQPKKSPQPKKALGSVLVARIKGSLATWAETKAELIDIGMGGAKGWSEAERDALDQDIAKPEPSAGKRKGGRL